jgi:hypothetical protein
MLPLLVALIVLLGFELVVWRFGADSRDGNDWCAPKPSRESPLVG